MVLNPNPQSVVVNEAVMYLLTNEQQGEDYS